jgi:hypothetical protein
MAILKNRATACQPPELIKHRRRLHTLGSPDAGLPNLLEHPRVDTVHGPGGLSSATGG